jgi:CheY-like chemotaxis protein
MAPLPSHSRPLVLVDDSADDLVFARRLIDKAGLRHPVLAFLSSEDALAHFASLARSARTPASLFPGVIFLDVNMPRLNGFELLVRLRKDKAYGQAKVVMFSSSDQPKDQERARALGADHYLVKFPAPEAFATVVANLW